MIGIYKITNPKGKVYIGQSVNIEKRFQTYKGLRCESQKRLYRSLLKYGYDNHIFEIITSCEKNELNEYERFYQEAYNCIGKKGLNCAYVNTSERKYIHSDSVIQKMSEQRKGRVLPPEWKAKVIMNLEKSRGRKSKPESIEKRRLKMIGYVHSDETRKKISDANKGKKKPESYSIKLSKRLKGKKLSEEHCRKIGIASKGRIFSEESKRKISENSAKTASKIVLFLDTGVFFESAKDAAKSLNYNYSTFKANLNGTSKVNRTNCIYI